MNKLIKIKGQNIYLCRRVQIVRTLKERMFGLMFRDHIDIKYDGMLIKHCNSIHTFFMRFPIDVIFLDKNFNIIKIINNMMPWRMSFLYLKACQVLELNGQTIPKNLKVGDQLEIICIN